MTIHTALVAEQSPTLRSLVTGVMEEGQTGRGTLDDVDEDTFARFAQFMYTGDYAPAAYVLREPEILATVEPKHDTYEPLEVDGTPPGTTVGALIDESLYEEAPVVEAPVVEAPVVEDPWSFSGFSNHRKDKGKKKSKPKSAQRRPFDERTYPLPASSTYLQKRCKARSNKSALEDYTPVFLGHTRLYALAEKYGVESLKWVVLNKLHETLRLFTPYEARHGDILELLRETYDNTPTLKQIDPLRELVTQYITSEAMQVIETEQCLSLVEEGGQLARDLFAMLFERLGHSREHPALDF